MLWSTCIELELVVDRGEILQKKAANARLLKPESSTNADGEESLSTQISDPSPIAMVSITESDQNDENMELKGDAESRSETDEDIREDESCNDDSDYEPVDIGNDESDSPDSNGLFVGELRKFHDFIASVNSNSACMTPGCVGKLVCYSLKRSKLGGAVDMNFKCNGCNNRNITFQSSSKYKPTMGRSQQTTVGFMLQVAFMIGGCTYAMYQRVLKYGLGLYCCTKTTFSSTIRKLLPSVTSILDSQCEMVKNDMKVLKDDELGNWNKAITCADGVWLTKGFHSTNGTATLRNYMNNSLLYYTHNCQKGSPNDTDLWHGTSKGMEGVALDELFEKAKLEGLNIVDHIQDADSSSAKALEKHFPEANLLLCGGHFNRSFSKSLDKIQMLKSFSRKKEIYYSELFEREKGLGSLKCHCSTHSYKTCGCLSDEFITQSKKSLMQLLINAGTDHKKFANDLEILGKYHSRDIHDQCTFHDKVVCSCGNCKGGLNLSCGGKLYHSKYVLHCPFHAKAFEMECLDCARQSKNLIHPRLGKVHTNHLESSHSILIKFRSKDIAF